MIPFKFFSGYDNSIDLYLNTVNLDTTLRRLRAQWTPETEQDLSAYHGIDITSELSNMLSEQIAAEIDNEIIRNLNTFVTVTFPNVQRLSARTLSNDLISVQPLNPPMGNLYYYDHKNNLRQFKFFVGW